MLLIKERGFSMLLAVALELLLGHADAFEDSFSVSSERKELC